MDGSLWMMKLLKCFGAGMQADPMRFMKLWLAHFAKDIFKFQMDFLDDFCQLYGHQLKKVLEISPQEMSHVLDGSNTSLNKYMKIQQLVKDMMEKEGHGALCVLPSMGSVKAQLQAANKKIPKIFDLMTSTGVNGKKFAFCRLAAIVEWISYSMVGLSNLGNAASWKLHTDGRQIQKGVSQVVFSVQPVGLPLWHFSSGGRQSKKFPEKNKQWAKDSSYLVFPFLIYQGAESSTDFRATIPKEVFSDIIRLEHDGLRFSPLEGTGDDEGENEVLAGGPHFSHGFLKGCEVGSLKWCGGVLFQLKGDVGGGTLPRWRANAEGVERPSICGNHGGFSQDNKLEWKAVRGFQQGECMRKERETLKQYVKEALEQRKAEWGDYCREETLMRANMETLRGVSERLGWDKVHILCL